MGGGIMSRDCSVVREVAAKALDWPGLSPIFTDEEKDFLHAMTTTSVYPDEAQRAQLLDLTKRHDEASRELYRTMMAQAFAEEIAEGRMDSAEKTAGAILPNGEGA
jgi:hypothetical protein